MLSFSFFFVGTLLLSLNFVRPMGLAISDWFYFLSLNVAFLQSIHSKKLYYWIKNRFLLPAGFILLGAVISSFRTYYINDALFETVQQIYIITLFVSLIWIAHNRGKSKVILYAFIASGVFTSSIAGIDFFFGTQFGPYLSDTLNSHLYNRYAGTLGHPNKFGCFVVATTLLSLAKLLTSRYWIRNNYLKITWSLIVAVQLFGVFLSGSVTAFIGLILGLVILIIYSKEATKRISKYWILILITVVILLLIGGIVSGDEYSRGPTSNSYIALSINRVLSTTALSRWVVYKETIENILQNPIVGVGVDQVSTSTISDFERLASGKVHNIFLQVWYTGGVFALVGWLVIYVMLLKAAIFVLRNYKPTKNSFATLGIASASLSFILMDQFQDTIYQREKWLLYGLLIVFAWSEKEISQKRKMRINDS